MADRQAGIQIGEEPGFDQAIVAVPTAVTAFVGRCLRGPLDQPVTVASFADFQRVFGGLWQPSMLAYAVEQYFENGGQAAIVVRVANGARCCTLALPSGDAVLLLRALAPGTREFLRAAVDYDGIGANEDDRFNLVLQRVRAPGSEHIEEQEIHRRLSIRPAAQRFVTAVLAESALARVAGPVPEVRPGPTPPPDPRGLAGYVLSNPDGDDGGPLSDYDLIGSAARATGIFALTGVEHFNLLCIPPPARDRDVGPGVLLVANRFCRERRALLLVDPPLAWDSPARALAALRDWPLPSDSACMYFPRLLAYDKLRGRFEAFAPSAAVAGMLARVSTDTPVWAATLGAEAVLRPGVRPLCTLDDEQRQRLAAAGVNVVPTVRRAERAPLDACTLAGPGAAVADWRSLGRRRLDQMIVSSIERGTRWMLFEPNEPRTWRRAAMQVCAFLAALEDQGAFAGHEAGDRWFVVCDERVNRPAQRERGIINLLFGFGAARPGEFHSYLVSHRAGGSRVQAASPNLSGRSATGITQLLLNNAAGA